MASSNGTSAARRSEPMKLASDARERSTDKSDDRLKMEERPAGADRVKALDNALAQIERQFGKGAIMRLNENSKMQVSCVSTGSLSLDLALGGHGVPRGRVVEIFGPESSGKTTLTSHIVAEIQKAGGIAAFVDAEHAYDPVYAKRLGVNVDDLLISQPDNGEQALEIVEALVRSNAVDVVVVDSVAALSQIERQYGKGTVMKMGDQAQVAIPSISTGSLSLDVALGVGGLPRGRIVEIFGPESSGKTTLVYHVIAEAQRRGGICAFIDAEHAMDPAYARRIGVNIDDLLVSQPDNGEQALEIAELLIRSGAIDVVAVDSVAALTPKAEIEGEMGDSHVGLQARLMSQALRKLAGTLNRTGTVALFTNQLREKIGVMFGNPETTPGGRALKFYSSVRLDIRRIETLKEGVEAIGNRVRVKVVKNKVAPPFKQAEFDIIYGDGISWEGTVLEVGLEKKIVQKSGSYFSYGDERLGQGRQNATAFLREHPDVAEQILRALQTELGPDAVVSSRLLPISDDASTPSKADAEAEAAEAAEQAADEVAAA
jgi:recombination protein RecA